jgi:hypothetical protein
MKLMFQLVLEGQGTDFWRWEYWKEPFFPLPLPKIAPTSLEKRFVRE